VRGGTRRRVTWTSGEFDDDANPLDILASVAELEEELGVKVDVCTARGLRPFVKEEIVAQAVRL